MRIPNLKDQELMQFLVEWDRELERMRKDTLSNVRANNSLLLISPSLKVFEVKVTDAGALVVTGAVGARGTVA
jgi:hypothetical protein